MDDPKLQGKQLKGSYSGCFRTRVMGVMRVVVRQLDEHRTLEILEIEYRGNAYRF